MKDTVNIQFTEIIRDKRNAIQWEKLRPERRKKLSSFKYFTRIRRKCYSIHVSNLENQDELAKFTRKTVGYGEWIISFWDTHYKRSQFNSLFQCRKGCIQKRTGVCKHNRMFVRCFAPRAVIIITPSRADGKDYSYQWVERSDGKHRDKMHLMFFWKGGKKKEKIISGNVISDPPKSEFQKIVDELYE